MFTKDQTLKKKNHIVIATLFTLCLLTSIMYCHSVVKIHLYLISLVIVLDIIKQYSWSQTLTMFCTKLKLSITIFDWCFAFEHFAVNYSSCPFFYEQPTLPMSHSTFFYIITHKSYCYYHVATFLFNHDPDFAFGNVCSLFGNCPFGVRSLSVYRPFNFQSMLPGSWFAS